MAATEIVPMGKTLSFKAIAMGALLGQTVSTNEIKNEVLSRGYKSGTEPSSPAVQVTPVTKARVTKTDAIKAAVDNTLQTYGYSTRCSKVGGCWIATTRFNLIVKTGQQLANSYINANYIPGQTLYAPTAYTAPSYGTARSPTPAPSYSPTAYDEAVKEYYARYFSGLSGLGQTLPNAAAPAPGEVATPPMSADEKIALALQILAAALTTAQTYYQGRAERQRLAAMGVTIPQMTAMEFQQMLAQYKLINPSVSDNKLNSVAAGAFNQPAPASTTPSWMIPAIAALGAVLLLTLIGRGRRR